MKMLNRDPIGLTPVLTAGIALALTLALITSCSAQQQTYSLLFSFGGNNGDYPNVLIRDGAGNLYGTTQYGTQNGWGTVFKIDPTGEATVLYTFQGQTDGGNPEVGLVMDSAGNVYGTTYQGGQLSGCLQVTTGCGVVFKLDPTGKESVLYTFTGASDGANPHGSLILDSAGNLYGTTLYGGNSNSGTVFKVDPTGHETVLYSFTGGADGGNPQAGLVMDQSGNLYGTTELGGTYLKGTVFEISAAGSETVLHTFAGAPDGAYPQSGLILDSAGNLYGTTFQGGEPSACYAAGCGVVFKLDSSGNETVLYTFTGAADGANPEGGVALDAAGNLYGTTYQGGISSACSSAGCGVVFKLDATGNQTVLHSFAGPKTDGANPTSGVIVDSQGNLYGTTLYGGAKSLGAAFTIASPGFLLSASALNPSAINAGTSASSTVNVAAIGGFNGSINLLCSVQPMVTRGPQCSISPSALVPGKSATLTVSTIGPGAATMASNSHGYLNFCFWIGLIGLAAGGLGFGSSQEKTRSTLTVVLICLAIASGMMFQSACGGGSGSRSGTPAGGYTITVSGAAQSAGISPQTVQLTVGVQ
jgi:uncharacterized repeat protein (TIGR03803 family)